MYQERYTSLSATESEVHQKNKSCILTHKCKIQKDSADELICKAGIKTQTQKMDFWRQQGQERVGEIESSIEINTLTCIKWIAVESCCITQGAQRSDLAKTIYVFNALIENIQMISAVKCSAPELYPLEDF